MKVRTINFDDDGMPETLTVDMTIVEAAAIVRVFGALNSHAGRKLGIDDGAVYYPLVVVLNRHYDEGWHHFGSWVDLRTINDPEQP